MNVDGEETHKTHFAAGICPLYVRQLCTFSVFAFAITIFTRQRRLPNSQKRQERGWVARSQFAGNHSCGESQNYLLELAD
jgi:hypothetical protein